MIPVINIISLFIRCIELSLQHQIMCYSIVFIFNAQIHFCNVLWQGWIWRSGLYFVFKFEFLLLNRPGCGWNCNWFTT